MSIKDGAKQWLATNFQGTYSSISQIEEISESFMSIMVNSSHL